MTTRARSLLAGVAALGKTLLLLVGVPAALARLWIVAPPVRAQVLVPDAGLALRALLGLVGLAWVLAARSLAVEFVGAARGRGAGSSGWSSRWAAALVGLLLLLAPTSLLDRAGSAGTPATPARTGAVVAKPAGAACLGDVALVLHGDPAAWVALARGHRDALLGAGSRFVDPNLLREGWCLGVGAPPIGAPASRHELDELGLLGLGVLTTAALARRVRTLRLAARASRRAGERLERTPGALDELEAAILPFGEATLLDWIEVANRLLGAAQREASRHLEVRLVRAGPDGVAFLLGEAVEPAIAPFAASEGGRWWTLRLDEPLAVHARASAGAPRAMPWLVPVGDDGQDAWLVPVGPGHHLVLSGELEARAATLRGVAAALRTLPWAEELQVELVGVPSPPSSERCYQLVASSAAELRELAAWPARPRHSPGEPTWRREPIVLLDEELDPGLVLAVNAVAGIVSTTGTGDLRLALAPEGGVARLEPFGVELVVPQPDAAAGELLERLLDRAAVQPRVVPLVEVPAAAGPVLEIGLELSGLRADLADLAERDRARTIELLAYVVTHYGEASEAALLAALFPGRGPSSQQRLSELALALRSALGAGADGATYLAIGRDGGLKLRAEVASDWSRFRQACRRASAAPPETALAAWRAAVDLAPTPPSDPPAWLVAEGHVAALVFDLCDARHQLAALCVATGALAEAEAVVRAGLLVEPTSELLLRDLLIVTELGGGGDALGERYGELEAALAEAGGIEPSAETRRLYETLATRRR